MSDKRHTPEEDIGEERCPNVDSKTDSHARNHIRAGETYKCCLLYTSVVIDIYITLKSRLYFTVRVTDLGWQGKLIRIY